MDQILSSQPLPQQVVVVVGALEPMVAATVAPVVVAYLLVWGAAAVLAIPQQPHPHKVIMVALVVLAAVRSLNTVVAVVGLVLLAVALLVRVVTAHQTLIQGRQ
jgi:hypothetical protein